MMKANALLKTGVAVAALLLQFSAAGGVGNCQENSGETVGRKVDNNLDAAKKRLDEWAEKVREWEAKGRKLGQDGKEEYLRLKDDFLRQKDDAVAKLKELHEKRGEITQAASEKFDQVYKEAENTFNKIKGLVKKTEDSDKPVK